MQQPRIRPMTPADAAPAADAILASGWGDRHGFFAFATRPGPCRPFVAEADGEVVGTGVATISGRSGWVGTIWVAPPWRNRGIGRALTEQVLGVLDDAGCTSCCLVASEAGRPVYERLGFEVRTWYHLLEAPAEATPAAATPTGGDGAATGLRVRPFRVADLPAMAELDAGATGEDRRGLLHALASPDSTRVAVDADGRLAGFLVRPPWSGGATIARDADVAVALLEQRRAAGAGRLLRTGLLHENEAGRARLEGLGWREAWRAVRMHRGAPLDWRPERIWGQFNHAVG